MINLIDVSGFIYRAFYALPSLTYKGEEVGALYGFCAAMRKITNLFPNSMFIAALDSGKKTFRNEIYTEYKANRKAMPEELISQISFIKEACEKFGFFISSKIGYEADDIIASYVSKIKGHKINIISSDKDLMQLMSDTVSIYDPMKQKYITEEDVFKKFGVNHQKILDVLSLMGDSSDNVPGVPGIGPKTAAELINKYGSIENLINHLDELPKNKRNETLKQEIDKAILSKELIKLKSDLDIDFEYKISKAENLEDFFKKFGFKRLLESKATQHQILSDSKPLMIKGDKLIILSDYDPSQLIKLKSKLENTDIQKICEDSKILIKDCYKNKIDVKNTFDVSVLSYCYIGTKISHTLELMAAEYGISSDSKEETLEKIYEYLLSHIDEKTKYLFFEIENKLTKVLAKMEGLGIKVDKTYLNELEIYFQEKIESTALQIYKIAGSEFNIASPKQVAFILYEKLGFKATKKQSTDAQTLKTFSGCHDGITDKILEWRGFSKLLNTYVKPLKDLADENSRVHTLYLQTVVNTGRLSSSEPNLQNIPNRTEEGQKIRRAFIARDGYKLVSFDYSQMELRLLAHIADCEKLKNSFLSGDDIHKSTAMHIFNVSKDNVTKDQRRIAKEINFSILYGISLHTLSQRLQITYSEASQIYSDFMGLYPEITDYITKTENYAKENGFVETIFGRKCFVPLIKSKNVNLVNFAKRQAVNAPIQGSNADIIKFAMVKLGNKDLDILLQIHDELVFEIPEEKVEDTIPFIKNTMENILKLNVPLIVDVKISSHL